MNDLRVERNVRSGAAVVLVAVAPASVVRVLAVLVAAVPSEGRA